MTLEQLKQEVERRYGFEISGQTRKRNVVYARKVFCKLGRLMNYTFQDIGNTIGVNHCSALYHNNTFYSVEDYDNKIYNSILEDYCEIEKDESNVESVVILEGKELEYKARIKELERKISVLEAKPTSLSEDIVKKVDSWDFETKIEFVDTRLVPFERLVKSRVMRKKPLAVEGAKIERRVKNPFLQ
jgi:hypothetical protein